MVEAKRPSNGVDRCPACDSDDITVRDSRCEEDGRRRSKKCQACDHRWTTMEVPALRSQLGRRNRPRVAGMVELHRSLAEMVRWFGRWPEMVPNAALPEPRQAVEDARALVSRVGAMVEAQPDGAADPEDDDALPWLRDEPGVPA